MHEKHAIYTQSKFKVSPQLHVMLCFYYTYDYRLSTTTLATYAMSMVQSFLAWINMLRNNTRDNYKRVCISREQKISPVTMLVGPPTICGSCARDCKWDALF